MRVALLCLLLAGCSSVYDTQITEANKASLPSTEALQGLPADERLLIGLYVVRYNFRGANERSANPATLPCTFREAIDRQRAAMELAAR